MVLLLVPGSSFSTLLDYFGPTSWMFYGALPGHSLIHTSIHLYMHTISSCAGLTASSLVVLRIREPHAARPFRVPLYPLPPILVRWYSYMCVCAVVMNGVVCCGVCCVRWC